MGEGTELGRVTTVLDVDDSRLKAGFARAHAEAQKFDQAGANAGARFSEGFNKSLQSGNFSNVGRAVGQDFSNALSAGFGPVGNVFANTAVALGPTGLIAGAAIAGAAIVTTEATKAAMAWESLGTSVGRSLNLDGKPLQDFMNDLQELRMEMGLTDQQAAAIAKQSGSIGVGQKWLDAGDIENYKKEVLDFSTAAAKISGAWEMSHDATAKGLGKMGSVTLGSWNRIRRERSQEEMSWEEFAKRVGGSTDAVANAFGSTEEEVVTASMHMSEAVAKWAPDEKSYAKWIALSSWMVHTGTSADETGTKMIRALDYMERDTEGGVSSLLRTDRAGLISRLKSDAVGTMQEVAKVIAAMPPAQRPDMTKLFGLEGKGLIEKMVADIDNGIGDLDRSINVSVEGFDHSKIDEGWGKVLDDAATQANRITQVFRVALEKIGTVGLPAVTAGMKAVADTGEWIVNTGSDVWGKAEDLKERSDKALVEGGLMEGFKAFLGIGEEIKPEVQKGVAEGTEAGIKEGAEAAAPEVAEAIAKPFGKAIDDAYKELLSKNVSKELASAKAFGGKILEDGTVQLLSDEEAYALYNRSQSSTDLHDVTVSKPISFLGQEFYKTRTEGGKGFYEQWLGPEGAITESKYFKDFTKGGTDASEEIAQTYYDDLKDSIVNTGNFMTDHYEKLGSRIGEIFGDGIYKEAEKAEVEAYEAFLNILEKEHPIEFKAAGLGDIRKQIEDMGKEAVEISIKPVWEDWTSEQFRAKWTYENHDWLKYLSPTERDAMQSEMARQSTLLEKGNAEEKSSAQNFFGAIDGLKVGIQGQTLSEQAYFDQSLITLQQIAPSIAAVLDKYMGVFAAGSAGGKGMTPGESYYDYSYTPRYKSGYSGTATAGRMSPVLSAAFISGLRKYGQGLTYFDGTSPEVAVVGDTEEFIIPVSEIKGLFPKSNIPDKASLSYQTGWNEFQNYPYKITGPTSYQWSKYPNAPPVNVSGDAPVAWLSEGQPSGMDYISSEIRDRQLRSIGNSQVLPWFARGYQDQPPWWVEKATSISPQDASTWAAQKGGVLPRIGSDIDSPEEYDAWATIYNDAGACIGYVPPDPSLTFTPGEKYRGPSGNLAPVYDSSGRISAFVEPGASMSLRSAGINGNFPISGGQSNAQTGPMLYGGSPQVSDALTNRMAWAAIYDDRGTCIAFVKPDPSLNFTPGKDYLPGGKGLGNMDLDYSSLGDKEIQTWDSIDSSLQDVAKSSEGTEKNTQETAKVWNNLFPAAGGAGMNALGAAMIFGGGGSFGSALAGWGSGSGIGGRYGSAFSGWYTGGTAGLGASHGSGGYSGSMGGTASSAARGGSSGSFSTSGSRGGVSWGWDEGGSLMLTQPTLFEMPGGGIGEAGEAGPELMVILPLNKPQRMRQILSEIAPVTGIQKFANGGVLGRADHVMPLGLPATSLPANTGPATITINDHRTVQASGLSTSQIKRLLREDHEELMEEIQRKFFEEKNVRTSK